MADPRLHFRSDSLTPRRTAVATATKPFATPAGTTPALTTKSTEVGCIGSTYLNMSSIGTGAYRALRFVGYGNMDDFTHGFSVLCRVIPRFTGFNPSSYGGLFTFNGFANTPYFFLRALTTGAFQFTGVNADFAQVFNAVSSSTHSFTSGTAADIVVTWTGTNATNGVKIYVNGTLLYQTTASANSNYTDAKGQLIEAFIAGVAWPQGELGGFDLNEFAVWNEVIDPTSGGLNLNGSSRADFVTSTAYDPNTWPAVASTLTTQTWNELGVSKTGTATLPTASNVKTGSGTYGVGGTGSTPSLTVPSLANTKIGVAGDGGTGTYDGSDRWTDPGEGNVRLSTAYKANSTSNNKTGTVVVPTAGNTKIGASTDVSGIGTYDGSDRWSDPGVSNVKNGTTYKANSTSDNRTGSLVSTDPGEQNVVEDVEYIIENVSHVGGFSVAESTDPGPENVLDGIQYIINDVPRVGTFDPNLNFESLRQFLNDILREIGSVSLTDEEYATIDLPDEYVYNSDVYNELDQVLLSRGDLNNDRAQLEYFFLARGVVLEPPEETVEIKSQILMGVAIDGAPSESTGKSNLFLGGPLE